MPAPRILNATQLALALGVGRTYVQAMKRGYVNEQGRLEQFVFTHGRWTALQPAIDWMEAHPEFRMRKAYKQPSPKKAQSQPA